MTQMTAMRWTSPLRTSWSYAESGSYAGLDAASDMVMDDINRERMSDFVSGVQCCSERTNDAESGSDAGFMDHVVDALMDDIWQCLQYEGNDNRTWHGPSWTCHTLCLTLLWCDGFGSSS